MAKENMAKDKKYQYVGSKIEDPEKIESKPDHTVVLTDQENNAVVLDMKDHFGKYKAEMFEPQTYRELGLDPERVFVRDHTLTGQMLREDAVIGDFDTND